MPAYDRLTGSFNDGQRSSSGRSFASSLRARLSDGEMTAIDAADPRVLE